MREKWVRSKSEKSEYVTKYIEGISAPYSHEPDPVIEKSLLTLPDVSLNTDDI